ncbi:hypothetical protein EV2_036592 [Malus domestica]
MGEIEVKWVRDNTFIITVQDESTATKILNQVPWVVMKQNFSVKRWSQELALMEVKVETILFWVQIRGVLLFLILEANVRRLATEIKEFMEFKDPSKARGFLRVGVMVNTSEPLITGCEGEHDTNPLDPMQTEEIQEARSRRKKRDTLESRGMRIGNNHAQWLMARVSPSFTHHLLMGYGSSSSSHPHILGVQSRQRQSLLVTIQKLPAESDIQTQGEDPGLTIGQLFPQLSMGMSADREQLTTLGVL